MPKINVNRSILIKQPKELVYKEINNFNKWKSWSPWLSLEKQAKVSIEPNGKAFNWEGDVIGAGQMSVLKEELNTSIYCDLTFLKPWKSKAKTNFFFKEVVGGTEVSWTMDSQIPFFMFWMKNSMENFIGMDYDRGLLMLKDKVESGASMCICFLLATFYFGLARASHER